MWFEHIVDEMVPIFGILMIIAVVIGPIWIKNYFAARDRAQMHETLRVAYEKGQPVPPELIKSLQSNVGDAPHCRRPSAICAGPSCLSRSVSGFAAWATACGMA